MVGKRDKSLPLVHGLRDGPNNITSKHTTIELYMRQWLEGQFDAMFISKETQASENAFSIDPSLYFFLMRVQSPFELVIFICHHNHTNQAQKGYSPFDSGGLWHGYLVDEPDVDTHKIDLFEQYNYDMYGGRVKFKQHLTERYPATLIEDNGISYIQGEKPDLGWWTDSGLNLKKGCDKRAWTWEVRISRASAQDSLDISHIFIPEIQYKKLRKELALELSDPEALQKFEQIAVVTTGSEEQLKASTELAEKYLYKYWKLNHAVW